MKILFLSHYFPPEVNAPATRVYEHCRAWVNAGHEVTVVTCLPNHPYGSVYEGYANQFMREDMDGIDVVRIKTYLAANRGFAKRTLSFVSYMFASIWQSLKLGSYDVVISTSPQFFNGLAGYAVSRMKHMPWVLEVRDLWPDSILAVDAIRSKAILASLYAVEKFAYQQCDQLVVVTDSFKTHIAAKGIPAEKITVIKNGADLTFFESNSQHDVVNSRMDDLGADFLKGKFVTSYVGTHGMAHKLETVLKAAELLKSDPYFHFLLVGDGAEREKLLQLKEEMQLDNVTMLAQRPKSDMPWIWSKTHLSLVHLRKDDVFKSVIPSKIFESMAMKKPIVLGVEGESAEMIKAADCGITIEPENADQLASAIKALAGAPMRLQTLGENGKRYVQENFSRETLAEIFAGLLSRTVTARIPQNDNSAVRITADTSELAGQHP